MLNSHYISQIPIYGNHRFAAEISGEPTLRRDMLRDSQNFGKQLPYFPPRRPKRPVAFRRGMEDSPARAAVALLPGAQIALLFQAMEQRVQGSWTDAVSVAREFL